MIKVSVVVPAYNSESFLGETLDSLLKQTLKEIEVVIVNDGSTDNTQDVIDNYCKKSDIFKCVEQENAGVSAARNNGLEQATGKYVLFLDADDLLTSGSLEAFYNAGERTGADVMIGRLRTFDENGMGKYNRFADYLSQKEEIGIFTKALLWNFLVSNKCYNREKLLESGVRFPGFRYSEEGAFFMRVVYSGVSITGVPGACMCYRRHSDEQGLSVSQTVSRELCESMMDSLNDIYSNALKAIETAPEEIDREDYIQEVIYKTAYQLLAQFYRLVWSGDEECFAYAAKEFVRLRKLMTKARFDVICRTDPDLHLNNMFMSVDDIIKRPNVTVILKNNGNADMSVLFDSLYKQVSPFFKLIVPQSMINSGRVPEKYIGMKNMLVLPDRDYMKKARKAASKRVIVFSKPVKLDIRDFRLIYRAHQIPDAVKDICFPVMIRGINYMLEKRILK